jgi:hypothetical protein
MIHVFELYIAGDTFVSRRARTNLAVACGQLLPGAHAIRVIDVVARPDLAEEAAVVVTPLVVSTGPGPALRVVGDFADVDRVIATLRPRLGHRTGVATHARELAPA